MPDRLSAWTKLDLPKIANRKKCVAVTGYKNLWIKSVNDNLHLTITACVAYNGSALTSMFVFPGHQINQDVMKKFTIEGSFIPVAQKGFMKSRLFNKWLEHCYISISAIIQMPMVLVYDG